MSNVCITTVVNAKYQRYLPMFIYFAKVSYPEYDIKIFLLGKIQKKYRDIIDYLLLYEDNIFLLENEFKERNYQEQELKMLRWILPSHEFQFYDYVYVGDIDLLICREFPTLQDQHLEHCRCSDLPYSNSVRPNSKRLTGLHFIKRESYFNVMNPVINKYYRLLREGKLKGKHNEELLYTMILEADLALPERRFRPVHGLHLGIWRRQRDWTSWKYIHAKNSENKNHYEYFKYIAGLKMYKTLIDSIPLFEIDNMNKFFKTQA